MLRLLHTADWHLGLRLRFVPGDRGARLRLERFEVLSRIAELARGEKVDAVLVAGDVFDDNAVGRGTLQAARDALAAFQPVPVLLLPGNHDPALPGGALGRLLPQEHGLHHVRPLLSQEAVELAGGTVFPCPLDRHRLHQDPTAKLPARKAGEGIRVALAHGSVLDFGQERETAQIIDRDEVLRRGFDYLALGDWHGFLSFGRRVAYAGTPEATRFSEKATGSVLRVEIDRPGAEPRVQAMPVARSLWQSHRATLNGQEDLGLLEGWVQRLQDKSFTLLELTLDGELSLSERARLDALLERWSEQLLHLRSRSQGLILRPTSQELADLRSEGFVGAALEELRAEDSEQANDALRLLYRWLQEEEACAS